MALNFVDTALVFICFVLLWILNKRRKTNKMLQERIEDLQFLCKQDFMVVNGLNVFLEDHRSKITCFEMPLRKLDRQCHGMMSNIKKQLADITALSDQFHTFRQEWQQKAVPIIAVPETTLLDNIESLKIRAELVNLKGYIDRELKSVKFVSDYNKSLVDEAVDDIDSDDFRRSLK